MSNTYFQFRDFRIEQDQCAMKVTTDACILGAWTPLREGVGRILDIGAGTGLLSLMLAQRLPDAHIVAVELHEAAAAQARHNVAMSRWASRIEVVAGDINDYRPDEKFDLIISNPPFFNKSLLSSDQPANMARHTLSLSHQDMLALISNFLNDEGYAAVLLPQTEYVLFSDLYSSHAVFEQERLLIRHHPEAEVKRVVSVFGNRERATVKDVSLEIKNEYGDYSSGFKRLLSPFYLQL